MVDVYDLSKSLMRFTRNELGTRRGWQEIGTVGADDEICRLRIY